MERMKAEAMEVSKDVRTLIENITDEGCTITVSNLGITISGILDIVVVNEFMF